MEILTCSFHFIVALDLDCTGDIDVKYYVRPLTSN